MLAALPGKEYQRILLCLTPISRGMGKTHYETEDSLKHGYFPNHFAWTE
jgi:hypothetical protein